MRNERHEKRRKKITMKKINIDTEAEAGEVIINAELLY